jgi:hypothetical protein
MSPLFLKMTSLGSLLAFPGPPWAPFGLPLASPGAQNDPKMTPKVKQSMYGGSFWAPKVLQDPPYDPQGLKGEPQGSKDDPQGSQNDPQGSQNDPQGHQNDPQGPKSDPQGPKNDPQGPNNDPHLDIITPQTHRELNNMPRPGGMRVSD